MKHMPHARALCAALLAVFGLAAAAVPASAQYYPGSGYNNGYNSGNDRQITGRIASFDRFNLTLQANNSRNRARGRDRDSDGDNDNDNRNNGNNGNWNGNNNGNWNGNNNNGRWNNNGGYNHGGYNNRGNELNVRLHQGTVINPTGTTLQPGMTVRVFGHRNSDGSFEADRIDVANNNYGRGY